MSFPWTSGKEARVVDVCAGDLVEVRLSAAPLGPGLAPAEGADAGYVPHLVYRPAFEHNRSDRLGGEQDSSDPNEWHLDLAPLYCPFVGQIFLAGGIGRNYMVRWKQSRCRQVHNPSWTITLRSIGATPIQLPQGIYAIEAPRDVDITLDAFGDSLPLSLAAGSRFPLGHLSQGTVVATGGGTVEALTCHVRI